MAHKSIDMEIDRNEGGIMATQKVPIIVGVMLLVPIVCVLIILLGYKIHQASKYLLQHIHDIQVPMSCINSDES